MDGSSDRIAPEVLKATVANGRYTARVSLPGHTDADSPPALDLRLRDRSLDGLEIAHMRNEIWHVALDLPDDILTEGVQALLLTAQDGTQILHSYPIASGVTLSEDLVTEVALLRAELDLLKRAFRRKLTED